MHLRSPAPGLGLKICVFVKQFEGLNSDNPEMTAASIWSQLEHPTFTFKNCQYLTLSNFKRSSFRSLSNWLVASLIRMGPTPDQSKKRAGYGQTPRARPVAWLRRGQPWDMAWLGHTSLIRLTRMLILVIQSRMSILVVGGMSSWVSAK